MQLDSVQGTRRLTYALQPVLSSRDAINCRSHGSLKASWKALQEFLRWPYLPLQLLAALRSFQRSLRHVHATRRNTKQSWKRRILKRFRTLAKSMAAQNRVLLEECTMSSLPNVSLILLYTFFFNYLL